MNIKNEGQLIEYNNEIDVIKKIDSPFIMKVIENFMIKNKYCIVCEYVDGCDLLTLMEKGSAINETDATNLLFKILVGVSHLHNSYIIHRDLKLENIIVKFENDKVDFNKIENLKIVDLGLGTFVKNNEQIKGLVGTPNYIPPEVFKGNEYDYRFDSFSIGVLYHIMIMYEFPYEGKTIKEVSRNMLMNTINFDGSK